MKEEVKKAWVEKTLLTAAKVRAKAKEVREKAAVNKPKPEQPKRKGGCSCHG